MSFPTTDDFYNYSQHRSIYFDVCVSVIFGRRGSRKDIVTGALVVVAMNLGAVMRFEVGREDLQEVEDLDDALV
ncbi:MAG: hypothetical protein EPN62_12875 [Candidimonas sp.]|nr:MAG: hypothetical protein EPN77_15670 [Candidimonas sp.]TAM22019.1 MAG: hypothetical protein EPN62_12875 [Candidimonas sp.]